MAQTVATCQATGQRQPSDFWGLTEPHVQGTVPNVIELSNCARQLNVIYFHGFHAMEAEEAAHNSRMKDVYGIIKTLGKDKRKTTNAMKDKCGNLLTEGLARRERWKENVEEILNRPIPDDPVTDVEIVNEISTDPITKAEIRTALRKMKNGKAGEGRHYSRIIKSRRDYSREMACKLFQNILGTRESAKNMEAGTDRLNTEER